MEIIYLLIFFLNTIYSFRILQKKKRLNFYIFLNFSSIFSNSTYPNRVLYFFSNFANIFELLYFYLIINSRSLINSNTFSIIYFLFILFFLFSLKQIFLLQEENYYKYSSVRYYFSMLSITFNI